MVTMDTPPPWGFMTDPETLRVKGVKPGGYAERAGFKAGWKILEFNGTSIADDTHYKALLDENKPKEASDEKYPPVRLTFGVSQVRVWGRCERVRPTLKLRDQD